MSDLQIAGYGYVMFTSRAKIPATLAACLPRAARSTAIELADSRALAITPGALLIASAEGTEEMPWTDFRSAHWNGDSRLLTISPVVTERGDLVFETLNDNVFTFTTAVRERIEASIVHDRTREFGDDGMVQILIRRGRDGQLFSQTIVAGSPEVVTANREVIDELERSAREAAGLPG